MARSRSTVRVKIDPKHLMGKAGDQLEKNMRMATVFVRDEVKKDLNRSQPVRILPSGAIIGLSPSKPGEPPKKITGQLQNSILTKVIRSTLSVTGLVGSNLKKAKYLELGTSKMAARPFLRPAILRNRVKILRIVGSGKKAF